MNKKMFIAGMAVLLSAGLLAACAKGGEPTAQGDAKPAPKPVKKSDITVSVYDVGIVPPEAGNLENNAWSKWINDNGPANVKFVPVALAKADEIFNTLFASGSAPDLIIHSKNKEYRDKLYNQKLIMPVDELIEKNSVEYKKLLQDYPEIKKIAAKPDGKMYELGSVQSLSVDNALFIRTDWLKKLNLKVPETVDELYEVAKAFAEKDPDGNGKNDTYGIALSFKSGDLVDAMFQNVNWVVDNGQVIYDWDRVREATAFKKKLYDEKIVDRDFLADKNGEKAKQDWIQGKVGIWGDNLLGNAYTVFESLKKNNPNAEVLTMPLPKSKFGQFSPVLLNPIIMGSMINAQAKDPAAVIQYYDFVIREARTLKFGLKDVHYKLNESGCPQSIDDEKFKKEVFYTQQYWAQIANRILDGKCGERTSEYNPNKPTEKEFINIHLKAKQDYMSEQRQPGTLTPYMPALPKDMALIQTNLAAITDFWKKAIVSGDAYGLDQALKDGKAFFEKGNGKQLEDWYKKWYEENKSQMIKHTDLYKYKVD